MYEAEKVAILKDILGSCKRTGSEYLFGCPFCHHHKLKLSLNLDKNKWKCWVCNSSGKSISYLVKKYGSKPDIERWKQHDECIDISSYDDSVEYLFSSDKNISVGIPVHLPNEYRNLHTTNTLLSRKVKNYLKSRGLTDETIFKYSIGYCNSGKYENRIVIPSFDKDGNVNFFISRTFVDNFIKYINADVPKNHVIFNELFLDFKKPITIVEGVFDAIKAGENSVPLLGSTLNEKDSYLFNTICANNTKVFISLDKDARKKELDIISLLLKYGIETEVVRIPNKYDDIGEMPLGEFEIYKEHSIPIRDQLDLLDIW